MAGKNTARLGILMLDSRFPRIPGDVGNAQTWPFPVRYAVVPGATPNAIVQQDPSPFVHAFIEAGRELIAAGCTGIATTCGFLAPLRSQLAAALQVPVAASALEQASQIQATLPPSTKIGILTISRGTLSTAHLTAADVPSSAVIHGVAHTDFAASILGNKDTLDVTRAEEELVAAAKDLIEDDKAIGPILLECTNMVPYAQQIAQATGRPVYSIYSYLTWFHESLAPRVFEKP